MNNKDTIPNLKEALYKDDYLTDKVIENAKVKRKAIKVNTVTKSQDDEKCRMLFYKDKVNYKDKACDHKTTKENDYKTNYSSLKIQETEPVKYKDKTHVGKVPRPKLKAAMEKAKVHKNKKEDKKFRSGKSTVKKMPVVKCYDMKTTPTNSKDMNPNSMKTSYKAYQKFKHMKVVMMKAKAVKELRDSGKCSETYIKG